MTKRKDRSSSKGASILSTAFNVGRKAINIGRKAISIKNKVSNTITKAKHHTRNIVNKGFQKVNHAQAAILDKIKPKTVPRTLENKINYINNAKSNEALSPDVAKHIWNEEAKSKREQLDKQIKQHFNNRVKIEESAKSPTDRARELDKSHAQFKELGLTNPLLSKVRSDPFFGQHYKTGADAHKLAYVSATLPFRNHAPSGFPPVQNLNTIKTNESPSIWKSMKIQHNPGELGGQRRNGKGKKKQ